MKREVIKPQITDKEMLDGVYGRQYAHLAKKYNPSPDESAAPERDVSSEPVKELSPLAEALPVTAPPTATATETDERSKRPKQGEARKRGGMKFSLDKATRQRIKIYIDERHFEKVKAITKVRYDNTRPGVCHALIDDILRQFFDDHNEEIGDILQQYTKNLTG